LFPWAPEIFDPGLLRGRRYVVDYDDAIFHNYDEHPSQILGSMFREKIPSVMRRAATVVAGNAYIRDFAISHGAGRVEIIPSVVDGEKFKPISNAAGQRGGVTVGWIGSPATQHLLEPVIPILARELRDGLDRFVTIGGRYERPLFAAHQSFPWSEQHEAQLVAELDVGLMPLRDTPFERGKCGFKLIQYMACGVPVIASPVGVNSTIVQPGVNGFLARSDDEWVAAIRTLKSSSERRRAMGAASRVIFERDYSFAVHAPRFERVLRNAAAEGR